MSLCQGCPASVPEAAVGPARGWEPFRSGFSALVMVLICVFK